jgi:dipeptidyl-peptidase-4
LSLKIANIVAMKKPLIIVATLLCLVCALNAQELTVERIYSSPALEGEAIQGLKISPDGSRVTFLKGKETDYERLDLWEYNLKDGESRLLFDSDELHSGDEKLSDEEKARRERLRLSGTGIVSYEWSKDGQALFFPLGGDVYYWRVGNPKAEKVVSTPEFETDVKFSPKGNYLSYIREQNLYVLDLKTRKETALTTEGGGTLKFGMAEFVAQEEMDRMTGYWWSEDESKIAFTRVDESPVAEATRSEIYADEIKMVKQRYPFAGSPNVTVDLGVISLADKETKWVNLGEDKDFYLPRVKWTKDPDLFTYQWQSRDQKTLRLNLVSWPSMDQTVLLTEKSPTWLNLHGDLRFLKDKKHFVWASERDGFKHLYLYDLEGNLIRKLTEGRWVVDEVKHVDEDAGLVYFTGRKDTPVERHLYAVALKGGEVRKISSRSGFHEVTFPEKGGSYVDDFSTAVTPTQVSLHNLKGERITWLLQNEIDEEHPLYPYRGSWIKPEFGSFKTEDGATLYYRLYKPANFDPKKKYPVLDYLYGGPGVQRVTNAWDRSTLFCQYMAQQGYAVFTVDNRGSHHRGKAFEEPLYRAMGTVEVADQVEGVKFLRSFPWVDPEKVGVHGSSYGGYLTLMCMFKAPEYFKAGAAGAPVTDWTLYDTHYTERYMGNPKENAEAYEASSVFPYATKLAGPLLIYHGMADDNVLFTNSTKLYKVLQDNNIAFTMMDYPGKKHRFSGKQTSMHLLNMIRTFFDTQFGVERP